MKSNSIFCLSCISFQSLVLSPLTWRRRGDVLVTSCVCWVFHRLTTGVSCALQIDGLLKGSHIRFFSTEDEYVASRLSIWVISGICARYCQSNYHGPMTVKVDNRKPTTSWTGDNNHVMKSRLLPGTMTCFLWLAVVLFKTIGK